jgi:hypothetical protein
MTLKELQEYLESFAAFFGDGAPWKLVLTIAAVIYPFLIRPVRHIVGSQKKAIYNSQH